MCRLCKKWLPKSPWQIHVYCFQSPVYIFWHEVKWMPSDSARHRWSPISQIALTTSLIINECHVEILIKLAIVLNISKSSWNTDALCYMAENDIIIRDITGKILLMALYENYERLANAAKGEQEGKRIATLGYTLYKYTQLTKSLGSICESLCVSDIIWAVK